MRGGSMSIVLPVAVTAVLLLALVGLCVMLAWRRRQIEQRRRDNQLYSVYKSQMRRERRERR